MKQCTIFPEDSTLDFFSGGNEQSRFNQLSQQTQNLHNQRAPQQQQQQLHPTDPLNHQVYASSLSKFFDFHKNQQQQQQQHPQYAPQQQLFMSEQLNMPNLMDQSRIIDTRRLNPQYLDQTNATNSKLRYEFYNFCCC